MLIDNNLEQDVETLKVSLIGLEAEHKIADRAYQAFIKQQDTVGGTDVISADPEAVALCYYQMLMTMNDVSAVESAVYLILREASSDVVIALEVMLYTNSVNAQLAFDSCLGTIALAEQQLAVQRQAANVTAREYTEFGAFEVAMA